MGDNNIFVCGSPGSMTPSGRSYRWICALVRVAVGNFQWLLVGFGFLGDVLTDFSRFSTIFGLLLLFFIMSFLGFLKANASFISLFRFDGSFFAACFGVIVGKFSVQLSMVGWFSYTLPTQKNYLGK